MIACRPGLIEAVGFVQQINTVARLLGGRVSINIVCGHTPTELNGYGCFLDHDRRYEQAGAFIGACRALWDDRRPVGKDAPIDEINPILQMRIDGHDAPEIYLGGNGRRRRPWRLDMRTACSESRSRPRRSGLISRSSWRPGKEVGILVALLARPTRAQAIAAAEDLVSHFTETNRAVHRDFERKSDSVAFVSTFDLARRSSSGWVTETLWAGAVPYLGVPAIAPVGSPEEIADGILEYKRIGVCNSSSWAGPIWRK